nr:MAG TPA: specific recognition protein 1 [Caudoviricetes sp.]
MRPRSGCCCGRERTGRSAWSAITVRQGQTRY